MTTEDVAEFSGFNHTDDDLLLQRYPWENTTHLTINGSELAYYVDSEGNRHYYQRNADGGVALLIFYAIMLTMVGAQSALFYWKKQHKRSYELVTLVGLWLVPVVVSIHFNFWKFILVWLLYTAVTGYWFKQCLFTKKLSSKSIPRSVYTWFLWVYKVSVAVGMAGYVLFLLELIGVGALLRPVVPQSLAVMLIWYGLYFGILGRDCAEVAADRMASVMGTGRRMAVSVKDCGICGSELKDDFLAAATGQAQARRRGREAVVQLACKHLFHEPCIRGWTIVGKKDTCPVCLEKVDMRSMYSDRPWETTNLTWIQMLDGVRYLIAWNPIIIMGLQFALHIMGLDKLQRRQQEELLAAANGTMVGNSTSPVF